MGGFSAQCHEATCWGLGKLENGRSGRFFVKNTAPSQAFGWALEARLFPGVAQKIPMVQPAILCLCRIFSHWARCFPKKVGSVAKAPGMKYLAMVARLKRDRVESVLAPIACPARDLRAAGKDRAQCDGGHLGTHVNPFGVVVEERTGTAEIGGRGPGWHPSKTRTTQGGFIVFAHAPERGAFPGACGSTDHNKPVAYLTYL